MIDSNSRLLLRFPYDKARVIPLILSVLFMLPTWMAAEEEPMPFQIGDIYRYDIKWGIFKVGEAEMIVEDAGGEHEGELKFVLTVRTTSWADTFYRVRNRIESYTDAMVTKSYHYLKNQQEGSRKREIVVTFDWESQEAQYSNYGEVLEPVEILENSHDPFSVLFAYRMKDFALGSNIKIPVSDGKKTLMADIAVVDRQRVRVKAGRFECLRVRPDTKDLGGVFSRSKNSSIDLWFSDDEHKMIVKMASKVSVGRFRVELRNYELGGELEKTSTAQVSAVSSD